jgi:hypothetical protein
MGVPSKRVVVVGLPHPCAGFPFGAAKVRKILIHRSLR